MRPCDQSYGLSVNAPFSEITHDIRDLTIDPVTTTAVAKNQLVWLIKKEDLILSNQPTEATATFSKNFNTNSPRTGTVPIYMYGGDRYDIPQRLANSRNGLLISRFQILLCLFTNAAQN
jgi:hypothetical protein